MHKPSNNTSHIRWVFVLIVLSALIFWRLNGTTQEAPAYISEVPASTGLATSFLLKHIFQHGAGSELYKVHRRLDITEEYLEKTGLDSVEMDVDKSEITTNNLEDVYAQNDWPAAFKGHNPWNMKMKVRSSDSTAKIRRLTERHTPGFLDSYLDYAIEVKGNPKKLNMINLQWDEEEELEIPDIQDKDTLVMLALMSSNAYVKFPKNDEEKKKSDWRDVGDPWMPDENNTNIEFGWDGDGVRGHVFVNEVNDTVVIALKGTSGAGVPGAGEDETTNNDKLNDNLLFLCCCARVSYLWSTVCDCYEKAYTCNQDCLEKELTRKDRYYQAVLDIYRNVSAIYPPEQYKVWLTGHSLGGSLASLLGRTYGLPVVAYEAPGELLATQRLHLPQPPGYPMYMEHIYHVGNTADPIFMGVCNGVSSTCNAAGYAMETACHTGKLCVYDVVTDKGWSVNVLNHRIHTVVDEIILKYNETAECVEQPPCRDCFNWRYVTHDDDEGDEPKLPNPLIPHISHHNTKPATRTSQKATNTEYDTSTDVAKSSTIVASETPSDLPNKEKCLKRTWYGWCSEWGPSDGQDSPDGLHNI